MTAAQAGDQQALAELLAEHLPLVYNIVRRALNGHADVDDVVQETMVRVVHGLPGLREPDRFRAWVVSIAFRQVQERGRALGAATANLPLDAVADRADPDADFAELTVDRIGLEGQRRELVEASWWLNPSDRKLLSLWSQELAGSLSRAEVAAALGLKPRHTAVRLKRMKAQLRFALAFTRAWKAVPGCPRLAATAKTWDGRIDQTWLRRFSRHIGSCARCGRFGHALPPLEQLLVPIGLLPLAGLIGGGAPTASGVTAVTAKAATMKAALPLAELVRRVGQYLTAKHVLAAGAALVSTVAVVGYAVHYPSGPGDSPPNGAPPALTVPSPTGRSQGAGLSPGPGLSPGSDLSPGTALSPGPGAAPPPPGVPGVAVADIFVAPTGDDRGTGSISSPYATLVKAVSVVRPGQTIALRGGTYRPSQPVTIVTSGTAAQRITLSNYRDERPVIDAGGLPANTWYINHRANFWTVQGLEIANSLTHPYVCQSCQYDVFRWLAFHDNGDSAFTLSGPGTVGNQILDSDFYNNHDDATSGENADGLAIKYGSGPGNVVKGCRFYNNSDDGLDLEEFSSAVTIDSSWSYGNGVNRWKYLNPGGDGSGFALGAGAFSGPVNHVITNSAAWDNATYGIYDSGNLGALLVTGNTAYRNGTAGFALPASASVLRENLALANAQDVVLGAAVKAAANSWNEPGWTVAALRSTVAATAQAKRQRNGSLPATSFLTNVRDGRKGASMTRTS